MKRAIGIGFVVGLIAALIGLGCKAALEPVCPRSNPHCDCMDPQRHIGCSDNYDNGFIGPAGPALPFFTAPHDGGVDGDAGGDR